MEEQTQSVEKEGVVVNCSCGRNEEEADSAVRQLSLLAARDVIRHSQRGGGDRGE